MKELQKRAHEITKSKGFDTSQVALQLLLISSEVAEALDCVSLENTEDKVTDLVLNHQKTMLELEILRRSRKLKDESKIHDPAGFKEELADIVIRVMSFCENWIDLEAEIEKKLRKNEKRPYLHGKEF